MTPAERIWQQREAIFFTHKWVPGPPDMTGTTCLVARDYIEFHTCLERSERDVVSQAIRNLYPDTWAEAAVYLQTSGGYTELPACWNDKFATYEQVCNVIDEAWRLAKEAESRV